MLWLWFSYISCVMCLCVVLFPFRQWFLMYRIRHGYVDTLWWSHRGLVHILVLTANSIVKRPRNYQGDIRENNGIILKNFYLDGTFQKTDAFKVCKLTTHPPTKKCPI